MTVAASAFYLALDALQHGGTASIRRFNSLTDCSFLGDDAYVSLSLQSTESECLTVIVIATCIGRLTSQWGSQPLCCCARCRPSGRSRCRRRGGVRTKKSPGAGAQAVRVSAGRRVEVSAVKNVPFPAAWRTIEALVEAYKTLSGAKVTMTLCRRVCNRWETI